MNLQEIAKAYQSIYLKEEVVEEEFGIEDLSQEEIDNLVEEIVEEFIEEGFSLDDIEEAFVDYAQEEELLSEARAARRRSGGKSYDEVKAEIDAKEKAAAERKAARVSKVETQKKTRKDQTGSVGSGSSGTVRSKGGSMGAEGKKGTALPAGKSGSLVDTRIKPVTVKVVDSAKKAVKKRRDETGSVGSGSSGTVRSKGGKMGSEGSKGTSLPAGKKEKGGAIVKRNETIGPKSEVKSGVRKALQYRMSKKDLSRANRRDDISAAPKSKTDKVKDAASSARVAVRSAGKNLKRKAGAALGKLASKLSEEGGELDTFDLVAAYMIDEGFASDFGGATALMAKLSSELVDDICESQLQLLDEATAMAKRGYDETKLRKPAGGGEAADRATALADKPTYGDSAKKAAREKLARSQRGDFRKTASASPGLHGYGHKSDDPKVKAKQAARGAQRGALTPNEKKQLGR